MDQGRLHARRKEGTLRFRRGPCSDRTCSSNCHPPKLPIYLATVCESHLTSLHSHSTSLIFTALLNYITSDLLLAYLPLVSISPPNNALVNRIQPTDPRSQLPIFQLGEGEFH